MRRRAAVSIHARLERVRVVRCGMAQHRDEYPDTVKAVKHASAFIKAPAGTVLYFVWQLMSSFGGHCSHDRPWQRGDRRGASKGVGVYVHLGSVVSYELRCAEE